MHFLERHGALLSIGFPLFKGLRFPFYLALCVPIYMYKWMGWQSIGPLVVAHYPLLLLGSVGHQSCKRNGAAAYTLGHIYTKIQTQIHKHSITTRGQWSLNKSLDLINLLPAMYLNVRPPNTLKSADIGWYWWQQGANYPEWHVRGPLVKVWFEQLKDALLHMRGDRWCHLRGGHPD